MVGYYSGIAAIFILIYCSEITLDSRRIATGGIGFSIRIGVFLAYLLGIWLSYRWFAILALLILVIFGVLLGFIPISPILLIKQGFEKRTKDTLLYLHDSYFDTETDIKEIKEANTNLVKWIDNIKALKSWKVLKPNLTRAILACVKELGRLESIVSFSYHILESQHAIDPKIAALFYPIFLIIGLL